MTLLRDLTLARPVHFQETSTCVYRLDFATDRLCSHPDFAPAQPQVREITCVPLAEPQNQPWRSRLVEPPTKTGKRSRKQPTDATEAQEQPEREKDSSDAATDAQGHEDL